MECTDGYARGVIGYGLRLPLLVYASSILVQLQLYPIESQLREIQSQAIGSRVITMPAKITKLPSGKYQVKTPNSIRAKGTTRDKAEKQQRLLNAIEHGWKPSGVIPSPRKR